MEAPPSTAIRWALDEGWTREAHLLANLQEHMAGRMLHKRPGMENVPEELQGMVRSPAESKAVPLDSMPLDEFDKRLAENYARGSSAEIVAARERGEAA